MGTSWNAFFDDYAIKTVTWTDKNKGAYVPTVGQCRVIKKAGITPSVLRPAKEFQIKVLDDDRVRVGASFYHAQRLTDPSRAPEPRMGHAFISSWLEKGDSLLLGVVAGELFAMKLNMSIGEQEVESRIANRAAQETVLAKAARAKGKPKTKLVSHQDFVRDPFVIKAALVRAKNLCEMPSCKTVLFQRDSGVDYLEVHHVIPLSEGGDDAMTNVAALCAQCHREQHFGKDRVIKRAVLKAAIDKHGS